MKGLLAIGLVAILALAGCASKSDTSSTSTTALTPTHATTATTTAANTTTKAPNLPPVITAFNATRANATSLRVTFTFGAHDSDGDNLTWHLDPRSNGTAAASGTHLPGNVTFAYAKAGLYNATLTVSDGNATVQKVLAVNATGAVPLKVLVTGATTITGNPAMCEPVPGTCSPGPAGGANACSGFDAGKSGQDCVFAAFDAAYAGHRFAVSGTGSQMMVDFWDSCDPVNGAYVGGGTIGMPLTGTIPKGAGCAILWDYAADPMGVTLTLSVG